MPYKDKEQAKEAARMRKQKQRSHPIMSHPNVTPEVMLLSRPNGTDYNPAEKLYDNPYYIDGTLRYLGPMSDGQVLDRLTV